MATRHIRTLPIRTSTYADEVMLRVLFKISPPKLRGIPSFYGSMDWLCCVWSQMHITRVVRAVSCECESVQVPCECVYKCCVSV